MIGIHLGKLLNAMLPPPQQGCEIGEKIPSVNRQAKKKDDLISGRSRPFRRDKGYHL